MSDKGVTRVGTYVWDAVAKDWIKYTGAGDLQIGAVEIKDATTDDRANVRVGTGGVYGMGIVDVEVSPIHAIKNNPSKVFGYDADGNMNSVTQTIDGTSYTKALGYDADGNLTSLSDWSEV